MDESGLAGDSHLAITAPAYPNPSFPDAVAINIYAKTEFGDFVFRGTPNSAGYLSKLELPSIDATNLADAEAKAHSAVASALSNIAVYLDVPMHIAQVDVTELANHNKQISILHPYRGTPLFRVPVSEMSADLRMYSGLYRDALNSNTTAYQFLCYYRIIEGLRKRNDERIVSIRANGGAPPRRAREIVPENSNYQRAWLDSLFPIIRQWDDLTLTEIFPENTKGKKLNDVVDRHMRPIRDRIAHTFLDDGAAGIHSDEIVDMRNLCRWLPLAKCLARAALRLEFPNLFDK